MRIVLVRHAEPQVSALVDPQEWSLSGVGRSAAEGLRDRLPSRGLWVTSTAVKAYETLLHARRAGSPSVTQGARLNEVRTVEPFDDDFRARRLAWFEGRLDDRHTGWETAREAAARFDAAVAEHSSMGAPLVIGSHGMVLTAWLVHGRGSVDEQAAGTFWEAMTFPDVIEVFQD